MELLQLKYFYAVAINQHISNTAKQLHIAQPSLTQTIHRLENELGVKLLNHREEILSLRNTAATL